MTVSDVLSGVPLKGPLPEGLGEADVAGLDYDSRRIAKDFLFFAFPGQKADGRRFAQDALDKGALAVVSEPVETSGLSDRPEARRHAGSRSSMGGALLRSRLGTSTGSRTGGSA